MTADHRLPVVFGAQPEPTDAVLLEEGFAPPPQGHITRFASGTHPLGCLCCLGQSPAATALAALFRARATGAAPFFARVVVIASPEGEAAVRAALEDNVLARARFRVGGPPR